MKKNIAIFAYAIFSAFPLFPNSHFQEISVLTQTTGIEDTRFLFQHHSHISLYNNNSFLMSLTAKPGVDQSHHFDVNAGFRKFFDKTGIGTNFSYATANNSGRFLHQLSPGIEFFFNRIQISTNHYFPLKNQTNKNNIKITHHPLTEFGITYRHSRELEICILSFFDHELKYWGYHSEVSFTFDESVRLSISPFYRKDEKGILFSFGISFGGKKSKKTQNIRKFNNFCFSSRVPTEKKKEPKMISVPSAILTQPILLVPIPYVDVEKENPERDGPLKPEPEKQDNENSTFDPHDGPDMPGEDQPKEKPSWFYNFFGTSGWFETKKDEKDPAPTSDLGTFSIDSSSASSSTDGGEGAALSSVESSSSISFSEIDIETSQGNGH